ncbi:putative ATP-grasp-modified RiPP [Kitasatospora sp. NPDC056327]|uniref:putative ATP-grasp-modified RiPP n=1 Tax=Kitasatospora sp. NPDC056327 TaxID=3345785 RepID=UPI0035DECF29
MSQTPVPWGLTRMRPYAAGGVVAVPRLTPVIDPETQVAVVVDEQGRRVELGSHGTSTAGVTPTQTTADGNPGSPTDSDSTESYDQDQSND